MDEKTKALKFVEHIKKHIQDGDEGLHRTDKVVCKICGKTIDEIAKEEPKC